MNQNSIFANSSIVAHGWYWALASSELATRDKKEVDIAGIKVLLYRTDSGLVVGVTPRCPHMGANLGSGTMESDGIRCGFHGWKFAHSGEFLETGSGDLHPKLNCNLGSTRNRSCDHDGLLKQDRRPRLRSFCVVERYGMIWIHTDHTHRDQSFPSFEGFLEADSISVPGKPTTRNCHPTLVLGGGIDEEHFNFVHQKTTRLTGQLRFEVKRLSMSSIAFKNVAPMMVTSLKGRILSALYGNVLHYKVTYHYASTAFAELGFPWMPLYCIFAYRPTSSGTTEGLNIYVTRKRNWGVFTFVAKVLAKLEMAFAHSILAPGGREDAIIQDRLQFEWSPWAFGNPSFSTFVDYVNEQPSFKLKS